MSETIPPPAPPPGFRVAAHLDRLPPYTPIEPFEVLSARLGRLPGQIHKLDANENPYGPSPNARRALAELAFPHIYPDPASRALRKALSEFTGVDMRFLLAGAGADELIDLLLRVLLEPGDRVLYNPPTFGMYSFDARLNAGQVLEVPRRPGFSLDLEAIEAAVAAEKPKVLFLATPNNPDGSFPPAEAIDRLLALPLVVVLDEAYIEFTGRGELGAGATRIREVSGHQNLVVLRTFSKLAGLAGLRVGYGAFPGWLLPALWKAKQPYNVNVAASAAALASLADREYLVETVSRITGEKVRLESVLRRFPFLEPYPSQANFILCRVTRGRAADLKDFLARRHGVLVRYFDKPGLDDHIRVSVGLPEATTALETALFDYALEMDFPVPGGPATDSASPQPADQNPVPLELPAAPPRQAVYTRRTNETQIELRLDLDGTGRHRIDTGIGFLDHMLTHLAVHGLFDLELTARGDLHIDVHHTVEDTALALGAAFAQALGDRKGIVRMGSAYAPMDEALAFAAVDLSGRPYTQVEVAWHTPAVGGIPASLFPHFLESFAVAARCNLHARVLAGRDDHHQAEALFKALARALDAACALDSRRQGAVPSTKGTLTA